MKSLKTKIIFTLVATLVLTSVFVTLPAIATSPYCVSEKCLAAEAAEAEATKQAESAEAAANTLEDEVERLNDEIRAYETRIAANEALAEDLAQQITENEEMLDTQQIALAAMIIDMHFEEQPEPIMVLAGSSSISDYAEKQARTQSVKDRINASAQAVIELKNELEKQKKEVERILFDQELQRNAIAEKRREQNELIAEYRDNAAAFTADAEAARKTKQNEIAAEIARLNSIGVVASGVNSYPYRDRCPGINLAFIAVGGYVCQCTSYAGWKVQEYWGIYISAWGNAYSWDDTARALGYRVDTTPEAHTVAVSNSGQWGHVMWVESVNDNGTINLSEYNNSYSAASGLPGDFGYRIGVPTSGLYFIHFD